jgi:hypothetical protein
VATNVAAIKFDLFPIAADSSASTLSEKSVSELVEKGEHCPMADLQLP